MYIGESISFLGGLILMFYLFMFVNSYYTTLTESCPRSYYKVYKDKKELYYISAKFIKLLIKKTIDISPSEKELFLNNYQDKKLTGKSDDVIKKHMKEEDVLEDDEIEKLFKEVDNTDN
jgi:NADH:ubiquinone oxidoreductase subunit